MNTFRLTTIAITCIILFSFNACNTDNKEVIEVTANSDKMVIEFYKADGETLLKGFQVVADTITEINAVVGYLTSSTPEPENCKPNGLIHFYNGEAELFTADFSIEGNCSEYVYTINGNKKVRALSETGKAYINNYYQTAKRLN